MLKRSRFQCRGRNSGDECMRQIPLLGLMRNYKRNIFCGFHTHHMALCCLSNKECSQAFDMPSC